jgi:hypothetical protein
MEDWNNHRMFFTTPQVRQRAAAQVGCALQESHTAAAGGGLPSSVISRYACYVLFAACLQHVQWMQLPCIPAGMLDSKAPSIGHSRQQVVSLCYERAAVCRGRVFDIAALT